MRSLIKKWFRKMLDEVETERLKEKVQSRLNEVDCQQHDLSNLREFEKEWLKPILEQILEEGVDVDIRTSKDVIPFVEY